MDFLCITHTQWFVSYRRSTVLEKTTQYYLVNEINKHNVIYSSRDELVELARAYDWLVKVKKSRPNTENLKNLLQLSWQKFNDCQLRWKEKDARMDAYLRQYCPTEVYMQSIHECMTVLEKKDRNFSDFVKSIQEFLFQTCYGGKYRGHWYLRAVIISETYLNNRDLAIQFCVEGLEDFNLSRSQSLELYNRLTKMESSHQIVRNLKPVYGVKRFEQETLYRDGYVTSIEDFVMKHYLSKGYTDGISNGSSIGNLFFGFLLWDIIYSTEYTDAFRYWEQSLPLDIGYSSFYERRKEKIQSRINEIQTFTKDQLIRCLTDSWKLNEDKKSPLINTEAIDLQRFIVIFLIRKHNLILRFFSSKLPFVLRLRK